MSRMRTWVGVGAAVAVLVGCQTSKGVVATKSTGDASAATAQEKMIWSSHSQRPEWTVTEPAAVGEVVSFVGVSAKNATEQMCRDDALRASINNIARYVGTFAYDQLTRLSTSYGLSSETVDPTIASKGMQEFISAAMVTRAKARLWYFEKWQTDVKEAYYLGWVLTDVSKAGLNEVNAEACGAQIEELKKRREQAADEKAKGQYESAIKMFEEMSARGMIP